MLIKLTKLVIEHAHYIRERDPACKSFMEALLLYPSVRVLIRYRIAHKLYEKGLRFIPRAIMQRGRKTTGIEIHPGAKIGKHLFVDHGMGIVIGETAEIGDNVTMYHGVTLGGTGNEADHKRHPTIGNDVIIGAGATILGPINIGDGAKIGAGTIVLHDVEPGRTAVGAKARII